ncbi:MAG: hypothetical protein SOW15_04910 [Ruminococcus callidus]|nr:hypothetical protein [Ruminococcus callidus]
MRMENGDSAIIPASRIEETDTSVIVTYMGKRTIINNAVLINVQTDKKYIKFAKLTNTKLGIIVEPIYSEKQEMPFAFSVSSKDNTKFTIEEFVDIFLDNLEVRTVISNGKYTFYRNNLIPTNWTLLSEKNLHSAYKKIQNAPVLSEKRINDKVIYQIDDYASRIPIFSSENIDEIISSYSFSENENDTVGSFLSSLMEQKKIISARLYEMTGIDKGTISEYLNDKRNQQKNYLVAISIALRLLPKQSKYLLSLADIVLSRKTQENLLCQLFLDSCAFNEEITVSKCNDILIHRGLQPLTNLRVDNQK